MSLFKNKKDFISQFEKYTTIRFKNLTLQTLENTVEFIEWIEKNGKKTDIALPGDDAIGDGATSIVQLSATKAKKFFVCNDTEVVACTITEYTSDEFIEAVRLLKIELCNALVIETILRTASERCPDVVKMTNEYNVEDYFLKVDEVFYASQDARVQMGFITERLYPITNPKFAYRDLKSLFTCLINLGKKHKAWVIHGDVKGNNFLAGCAGKTILFDYGMSFAKIEFEDGGELVFDSCFKKLDPSHCMHIDPMFLAFDLKLSSMKKYSSPYAEVYKERTKEFLIEKYLP